MKVIGEQRLLKEDTRSRTTWFRTPMKSFRRTTRSKSCRSMSSHSQCRWTRYKFKKLLPCHKWVPRTANMLRQASRSRPWRSQSQRCASATRRLSSCSWPTNCLVRWRVARTRSGRLWKKQKGSIWSGLSRPRLSPWTAQSSINRPRTTTSLSTSNSKRSIYRHRGWGSVSLSKTSFKETKLGIRNLRLALS